MKGGIMGRKGEGECRGTGQYTKGDGLHLDSFFFPLFVNDR